MLVDVRAEPASCSGQMAHQFDVNASRLGEVVDVDGAFAKLNSDEVCAQRVVRNAGIPIQVAVGRWVHREPRAVRR